MVRQKEKEGGNRGVRWGRKEEPVLCGPRNISKYRKAS